MTRGAAFFVLALALWPASARAAELLTWRDAVAEARSNHPELVSARERVNQSKADKTIAASPFFPQVGADLQASRSKSGRSSSTGAAGSVSSRSDSYSYGVSGSQLLFDGFRTYDEVERAAKNIEASRYDYDATSSEVRLGLRLAFVNLLRAQELTRLTEKIAARRLQSRELIQLRYDAGREHKGSLLTAEANRAQADFEVEQARRNVVLAQRRLATQLGRPTLAPLAAQGELELASPERAKPDLERLAETTPFLRQLVVLKEAAKWGVKSVRASFFPSVFADAGTGRNASSWPPEGTDWSLGVRVSVPVFEGWSRTAQLKKAAAAERQAAAEERSGRHGVIFALEEAWSRYQDALEDVDVQKKFLDAAAERSKIAESEYSTGLISFNDWIIIEDNFVRAEKSYLDARAAALNREAEWRQAKGETLDGE